MLMMHLSQNTSKQRKFTVRCESVVGKTNQKTAFKVRADNAKYIGFQLLIEL